MATKEFPTLRKELSTLGEIRGDVVYPLPVFSQRSGLSAWALRQARKRGLQFRIVGRRKYIVGSEWLRFLETADTQ